MFSRLLALSLGGINLHRYGRNGNIASHLLQHVAAPEDAYIGTVLEGLLWSTAQSASAIVAHAPVIGFKRELH